MSVILFGSFLSYMQSGLIKMIGYLIAFSGLFYYTFKLTDLNKKVFTWTAIYSIAFFLSTCLSLYVSLFLIESPGRFIQDMIYPLTTFMMIASFYPLIKKDGNALLRLILFLSFMSCFFAVLGVFGVLSSAGPFGELKLGRYIFGTTLRSTSGLMSNVNYYATTQASLALFYALSVSCIKVKLSTNDWLIVFLIALSSVLGSSRGVVLSLLVFCFVYFFLNYRSIRSNLSKYLVFFLSLISIPFVFYVLSFYWDDFYSIFRLERGLNARDEIWYAVFEAWLERPLLGWGVDTGSAMGLASAGEFEDRSAHSGYLHTLLRLGLVGFFIVYGGLLYFTWKTRKTLLLSYKSRVALSCFIFYLVNSFFRTYSFGGLGLLPLLAAASISVLIYSHIVKE